MVLIINNQLYLPIIPLLYFLVVSSVVILTAVFYLPIVYMIDPNTTSIMGDYLKLLAIFAYFIIGYNLRQLDLLDSTVKWYSLFGMLIGITGIMLTFFNIRIFMDLLFLAGTRFRGLMIDPNYYSVLQITSLVYFTRIENIKPRFKFFVVVIIVLSVFLSGSKTGVVTLGCYFIFRLLDYLFSSRKKISVVVLQLFLFALLVFLVPIAIYLFQALLTSITSFFPSFGRVSFLLTDFSAAISEDGSGREETWLTALNVIQLSPVIGIGIGTYTALVSEIYHFNSVAHNTFLQLSAEWGIPLAFTLFTYIFFLIGKVTLFPRDSSEMTLILRDIMLILLIGSMAISLNNARMLWLFLGALVFALNKQKDNRSF